MTATPEAEVAAEGDAGPCRDIHEIAINSAPNLQAADRTRLTKAYVGRCLHVRDIEQLMADVTNAYIERGYATTRVYLPQQDLSKGKLTLAVAEGVVEKITLAGKGSDRISVGGAMPGRGRRAAQSARSRAGARSDQSPAVESRDVRRSSGRGRRQQPHRRAQPGGSRVPLRRDRRHTGSGLDRREPGWPQHRARQPVRSQRLREPAVSAVAAGAYGRSVFEARQLQLPHSRTVTAPRRWPTAAPTTRAS